MKYIERDGKIYVEFESLEEANESMHEALKLLKDTSYWLSKSKYALPKALADRIHDFMGEQGYPEE